MRNMKPLNLHEMKWLTRRLNREFNRRRVWNVDAKYWKRFERQKMQSRWPLDIMVRIKAKANAFYKEN